MIFARWCWVKRKFTNSGVKIYCRENLLINHYIYNFTTFRYNKLFHIRITKDIYKTSKWELCKLVFYITRQLFCVSDWSWVICPLYWVFYLSIVSYCIVIPRTDVSSYWFLVNWCCFCLSWLWFLLCSLSSMKYIYWYVFYLSLSTIFQLYRGGYLSLVLFWIQYILIMIPRTLFPLISIPCFVYQNCDY